MMDAQWTTREVAFLRALTLDVAWARVDQAQTIYELAREPSHGLRSSSQKSERVFHHKTAFRRMVRAGLIDCFTLNVVSLAPREPVFIFRPGDPEPDYLAISDELHERWKARAGMPTEMVIATTRTANLYGARVQIPELEARNHDVLLTEVFCHYLKHCPSEARDWVGEAVLPKAGHKVKDPDAFLVRDGKRYRIVESGGAYSANHIRELCRYTENLAQHHDPTLTLHIW